MLHIIKMCSSRTTLLFYVLCSSVVTQSAVRPEPDADRDAVGRCDAEQVSDRSHNHPAAELRPTENTWQVCLYQIQP